MAYCTVHPTRCAKARLVAAAAALACAGALAAPLDTDLACERAIATVEARIPELPRGLLAAVGRIESGRVGSDGRHRPWPYTVNVDGKGHYFSSKDAALAFLREPQTQRARSVDVGCMQISLKHHPLAFEARAEGFDPQRNVDYAAQYLQQLRQQHGGWDAAVSYYHSSEPARQGRYLALVNRSRGRAPEPAQRSAQAIPATPAHAGLIRVSDVATRPPVPATVAEGQLEQARRAFMAGEHAAAAQMCAAIPAESPDYIEAQFCLALAAEMTGDARTAMRHFVAVLVRKPADGPTLTTVLRLAQQSPDAASDWDKGARWNQPQDALPALLTLARSGAPQLVELLTRAETLASDSADLRSMMVVAMTWEQAGQIDHARRAFNTVLRRIPKQQASFITAVQDRIDALTKPATPTGRPSATKGQVKR
ncbi:MAG: hypothetical protein B7X59_00560 [Polaromonas sp. 39-63-203]|jgi:hypothetical protein|uniref:hypothetical protein n=1 Tax=Polaromonas sp. TaxID=1869339 RepID=UPI000BDCB818|nr:hypothetical protein [Polaromonas sp.]OYY53723.1 MAG: hypothetical protein B7Y54_01895 [Polaromonas sp. 35-63-240]OYZ03430.1 MAG: hypothetical protein B7Y42_00745 [Polaromonas sp. 28-63-22]OYZ85265.1 MAG: hypothetical protein B7Y03_00265 [Polaromonas sp. 24-62-144]OZB02433.1 MAG: hypothetical protein B7X59_00560 [Polaromonas sp. 39-63-203]HQS31402.1 hypothetical protein [Polaromonas sp.]